MAKKSKQDLADEKQRAKSLRQTQKNMAALFETVLRDGYQRLINISDEEWRAALEADAEEATNGS